MSAFGGGIRPWARQPAGSSASPCFQSGLFLLPKLYKMGLSSSRTHPRVTQVAPMLSGEEVLGGPSLHPTATTQHGHPITHGQLPPLRQTGYGRASTGMGRGGEAFPSNRFPPQSLLGRSQSSAHSIPAVPDTAFISQPHNVHRWAQPYHYLN